MSVNQTFVTSVLGVGTELTDGQIINRNAGWISQKTKTLGLRTGHHLSVPDDRNLIRQGLDYLEKKSEFIFVTGGLGPTTDDFTRELIAEWAEVPLVLSDEVWNFVQERLSSRGYPVQDFQKQQCYFPEGAILLPNPIGTAYGFRLKVRSKDCIVLPGPPREIEAIWNSSLLSWLESLQLSPWLTLSWDTMGLGESQVATLVEPIIEKFRVDIPQIKFEIGYRVHLPYVEFKIMLSSQDQTILSPLITEIEKNLHAITVLRDGIDIVDQFWNLLSEKHPEFVIEDQVSQSFLEERLHKGFKNLGKFKKWEFCNHIPVENSATHLWLRPINECEVTIGISGNKSEQINIKTPMISAEMSERRRQYFSELALIHWCRFLKGV